MPKPSWFHLLLLALAPLMWAGNQVVGRGIHEQISPVALNFWRWVLATLVLVVLVAPSLRAAWPAIRSHWARLAALGLVGATLFQTLLYWGLSHTTAINAVVLNSSLPAFMVAISWVLLGDRLSPRQVLGGVVSFTGVLVIVSGGDLEALKSLRFGGGDLLILAAMPLWALYSVLVRRWAVPLPPLVLLAAVACFGLAFMGPLYAVDRFILGHAFAPTLPVIGAIAYIGLFASIGAFLCWNLGVQHAGANVAGFVYHLLPAYGTVLAVLFLGEEPKLFHLWGLALILAGVFVSTVSPGRRPLPQTGRSG